MGSPVDMACRYDALLMFQAEGNRPALAAATTTEAAIATKPAVDTTLMATKPASDATTPMVATNPVQKTILLLGSEIIVDATTATSTTTTTTTATTFWC